MAGLWLLSTMRMVPGQAQPATVDQPLPVEPDTITQAMVPQPGGRDERDTAEWQALQRKTGDLVKADPQAALQAYAQFLKAHARLSPYVGVQLSLAMAHLYRDNFKDLVKAHEWWEFGIQHYANHPDSPYLLQEKAQALLDAAKPEEAEALLREHWTMLERGYPWAAMGAVQVYDTALQKQDKMAEVVNLLSVALLDFPTMLSGGTSANDDWVYNDLTGALVRQKRGEEALGWAKLRFMAALYDRDSISRASRLLAQVWPTLQPEHKGLDDFVAAQKRTDLDNPLLPIKVPPPPLDAKLLQQRMAHASAHDQITFYIWLGSFGPAMSRARQMLNSADKQEVHDGVLEACRIFKAADLNLKRANALLAYRQTRQGVDPVEEFLKAPTP